MASYSEMEAECLKVGMGDLREKNSVWFNPAYRPAIDRLCDLGLIVSGSRPYSDGHVERIPLSLSPHGIEEAKRLAA